MPIEFPEAIKGAFTSINPSNEPKEIDSKIADERTKKVALKWLRQHPAILDTSNQAKKLYASLQINVGFNLFERVCNAVRDFFTPAWTPPPALKEWVNNPSGATDTNFLMQLLHYSQESDRPKIFSFLRDGFDCGAITCEQLKTALIAQDKDGKTFLHNDKYLQEFVDCFSVEQLRTLAQETYKDKNILANTQLLLNALNAKINPRSASQPKKPPLDLMRDEW